MKLGIEESFEFNPEGHFWRIRDYDDVAEDASNYPGAIVWEREGTEDEGGWYPDDVRAEFERLTGKAEFGNAEPGPFNLVEMVADEAAGFNQSCAYGYLVDGHAVYCHNTDWLYAPRKCRRTWYTGGEVRDEDCRGYKPRQ